jgi:hypothetical protein
MKENLLARSEDWKVWTDWYDARLDGRRANETLEVARATIADEIWEQGPKVVNAEIKRLIEEHGGTTLPLEAGSFAVGAVTAAGSLEIARPVAEHATSSKEPELLEPSSEPGPVMQVTEKGLEVVPQPMGGDFDQDLQKNLHTRLQRLLPALAETTHKVGNAHPALDHVVSEYGALIAQPFEKLDVASVWAVGTGLLAFRQAFASQPNSTMTVPLEPGHLALLQQAAEVHGGFILGFPKGRELTDRADHARLSPEIVAQISRPTRYILTDLSLAKHFVESHTREFLAAIDEGTIVYGWEAARAGHVGYVVTRNSLIALGRALNHLNSALATVAGGLLLSAVDPNLQMTQYIAEFVFEHAQPIASFIEPFPELNIWFGSIIDHIDENKRSLKRKD